MHGHGPAVGNRRLAQDRPRQRLTRGGPRRVGAEGYERTAARTGYRNGSRERPSDTRVGSVEPRVPQVRDGQLLPEPAGATPALVAAVQQEYV
jgi:transposase-like protein